MKCPNDQATLLITERQNIEIDYCPECRGIWLDRGELDKLIEKDQPSVGRQPMYRQESPSVGRQHYESSYDSKHLSKKKHRESFLGDLFDF